MAIIKIQFTRCIQDSQEYGSNDQHMISRIFFNLIVNGLTHTDFYCDMKQVVGTDYENTPLEVSGPKGTTYRGPFDQQKFREAVEIYYRRCVGFSDSRIRMAPGIKGMRMRNHIFYIREDAEFEAHGTDTAGEGIPAQDGLLMKPKISHKSLGYSKGGWYEIVGVAGTITSLGGASGAITILITQGPSGTLERYNLSFFDTVIMTIIGLFLIGFAYIIEKYSESDNK